MPDVEGGCCDCGVEGEMVNHSCQLPCAQEFKGQQSSTANDEGNMNSPHEGHVGLPTLVPSWLRSERV